MTDLAQRALEQSLVKLVRVTPVSKVAIGDLTRDCGVSRSTFYYHYRDIYDLVGQVVVARFGVVIGKDRGQGSWPEGLRRVMEELRRDEVFIRNVYAGVDHNKARVYLMEQGENLMYGVAHQEAEAIGADDEAARGVAHVYAFIFVGALVEWVSEGMQRDIDEVIDDLRTTLDGSFAHSLANWKLRNDRGGKKKR